MHLGIIPFLLLFIPILEIAVFIMVGGQIGVASTLGMILVTAILGSILLRIQGISTLARIQEKSRDGAIPGKELVNGVMIMIAGVLLLTPGFVTDGHPFGQHQNRNAEDVVDLDPSEFSEKPNPDSPWNKIDDK